MSGSLGDWLGFLGRLAVGGALVAAGALKASAPSQEFAVVIDAYRIVSPGASLAIAAVLPWAELVVGFCLLLGDFTRPAAAAAGGLVASFVAALLSVKMRHMELPNCGCFGAAFHPSLGHALAMDAVLFILAYAAYSRGARLWSWDRWASGPARERHG